MVLRRCRDSSSVAEGCIDGGFIDRWAAVMTTRDDRDERTSPPRTDKGLERTPKAPGVRFAIGSRQCISKSDTTDGRGEHIKT